MDGGSLLPTRRAAGGGRAVPSTFAELGRRFDCPSLTTGGEWRSGRPSPVGSYEIRAQVAQSVEQRFCKPQVVGSSPTLGSHLRLRATAGLVFG